MITFEEARNIIDSRYDIVEDWGDAWLFTREGTEKLIGGDQGRIVMKDTGEILRPYEYYLRDAAMD